MNNALHYNPKAKIFPFSHVVRVLKMPLKIEQVIAINR